MYTEQITEISRGICMVNEQPWSAQWATWTTGSLDFSQESYTLSLGTLQTYIYSWYPLTTLDTANTCTILALHMITKCGF